MANMRAGILLGSILFFQSRWAVGQPPSLRNGDPSVRELSSSSPVAS